MIGWLWRSSLSLPSPSPLSLSLSLSLSVAVASVLAMVTLRLEKIEEREEGGGRTQEKSIEKLAFFMWTIGCLILLNSAYNPYVKSDKHAHEITVNDLDYWSGKILIQW